MLHVLGRVADSELAILTHSNLLARVEMSYSRNHETADQLQQAEIDKFAPLVAVHVATSVRAKKDTHEATQAHLDLEFLKSRMDIDDPQSRWQEIFDAEASCCV